MLSDSFSQQPVTRGQGQNVLTRQTYKQQQQKLWTFCSIYHLNCWLKWYKFNSGQIHVSSSGHYHQTWLHHSQNIFVKNVTDAVIAVLFADVVMDGFSTCCVSPSRRSPNVEWDIRGSSRSAVIRPLVPSVSCHPSTRLFGVLLFCSDHHVLCPLSHRVPTIERGVGGSSQSVVIHLQRVYRRVIHR